MTTSNTTNFDLDLISIIEEAYERCGVSYKEGYDFKTAKRSLSLMVIEWANRGINLWTLDAGSIPLVAGTATYDLPSDTIDVLEVSLRVGSGSTATDFSLGRISMSSYANIANKNQIGRPLQFWVNRLSGAMEPSGRKNSKITLWPIPESDADSSLVYYRLRRIQDTGDGINTQDIPFRFLPVFIAGLAYYSAIKLPEATDRIPMLKNMYDEAWQQASEEDRDRSPLRLVPRMY